MRLRLIGENLGAPPAATSWGDDRVDVFAANKQGVLCHWWSTDAFTYGFEELRTPTIGTPLGARGIMPALSPAVVASGSDRLDVFCVGLDARVHWWSWDGTWPFRHSVLQQGNSSFPAAAVAAVSWAAGRLDVFAVDASARLQHWWKSEPGGWNGPEDLGGGPSAAGPHAASWGPDRLDVVTVGKDANLQHWWWDGVFPWKFESIAARLHPVEPNIVSLGHQPNLYPTYDRSTGLPLRAPLVGPQPNTLAIRCAGPEGLVHRWRLEPEGLQHDTLTRSFERGVILDDMFSGPFIPFTGSKLCVVPDARRGIIVLGADHHGIIHDWSEGLDGTIFTGGGRLDVGTAVVTPSAVHSHFVGLPTTNLYFFAKGGVLGHAVQFKGVWEPTGAFQAVSPTLRGHGERPSWGGRSPGVAAPGH